MFPIVCTNCKTRFALGLLRCPRCQQVSPQYAATVKEMYMPKITVAAGPSNAGAKPGEVGYIERAEHRAAEVEKEAVAEAKAEVHAVEAWASKSVAHLRKAAEERGLDAAGSKATLAARLTEHEAAKAPAEAAPAADPASEAAPAEAAETPATTAAG